MPRSGRDHSVPIKDLFAVYRARLRAPQGTVVKEVVAVVQEVVGVSVPEDRFTYNVHTKTVSCRAPGPVRSEIAFHHAEIIASLQKRLGKQSAPTSIT